MSKEEQQQTGKLPCPHRVVDEMGSAFAMGCIGGAVFHAARGFRHSPVGGRMRGAVSMVRLRAPKLGGSFAEWGGIYAATECALRRMRKGKEDGWSAIISGAITGGMLALRGGVKAAAKAAFSGAALMGVIEGAGLLLHKWRGRKQKEIK